MGTYGNEIIPLVVPLYPHTPKPNPKPKIALFKISAHSPTTSPKPPNFHSVARSIKLRIYAIS